MNDTNNTSAAKNKSLFKLYDSDGQYHIYIRPGREHWFDIVGCHEPHHDGTAEDFDGVLFDAVEVSAEQVAAQVAAEIERKERLKRAEQFLRDYIDFRDFLSRRPSKKGKLRLQKPEVSN